MAVYEKSKVEYFRNRMRAIENKAHTIIDLLQSVTHRPSSSLLDTVDSQLQELLLKVAKEVLYDYKPD